MFLITFYAGFLGAIISTFGIVYLAWEGHQSTNPKPISQVVAQQSEALRNFRLSIWIGGTLIAITMYFYVIPRIDHDLFIALSFSLVYCSELLLSIVPDRNGREAFIHRVFGYGMAGGMLITALLFAISLHKTASHIEAALVAMMMALAILTTFDYKRFIFYELPFIGLSHISILVAVISLR